MKAELGADGTIVLRAPSNAATIVRQIPGARHDAKRQVWLLPLSWATCVTARGVLGSQLEVGPKLAEWARTELATRIKPALELREAKELPPTSPWASALANLEVELGASTGEAVGSGQPGSTTEPALEQASVAPAPRARRARSAKPSRQPAVRRIRDYPEVDNSGEWWWPHWQGMPEFIMADLTPWKTIKVHFECEEDMRAFAELVQQRVPGRGPGGSIWYPEAEIGHFADKRYISL